MFPTRKPTALAEAPSSAHTSELQHVSELQTYFGFVWQDCVSFCLVGQLVLIDLLVDWFNG